MRNEKNTPTNSLSTIPFPSPLARKFGVPVLCFMWNSSPWGSLGGWGTWRGLCLSSSDSEWHLVPVLRSEGWGFSPRLLSAPTAQFCAGVTLRLKSDDGKGKWKNKTCTPREVSLHIRYPSPLSCHYCFSESSCKRFRLEELVVCSQQERKPVFIPSSPEPKVLSLTFLIKITFG